MNKIFTVVFHYSHYSLGEPLSWRKDLAFGRAKKLFWWNKSGSICLIFNVVQPDYSIHFLS